jgi:hypothetical protein
VGPQVRLAEKPRRYADEDAREHLLEARQALRRPAGVAAHDLAGLGPLVALHAGQQDEGVVVRGGRALGHGPDHLERARPRIQCFHRLVGIARVVRQPPAQRQAPGALDVAVHRELAVVGAIDTRERIGLAIQAGGAVGAQLVPPVGPRLLALLDVLADANEVVVGDQ